MGVRRSHRFDFTGRWLELLERTEAKKVVALPQGIEADLRLLQRRPVERKHVTRWRVGVHAFEMSGQQRLHSIVVEVIGFDDGHPVVSRRRDDDTASLAPR